jgi:hypothetical protein
MVAMPVDRSICMPSVRPASGVPASPRCASSTGITVTVTRRPSAVPHCDSADSASSASASPISPMPSDSTPPSVAASDADCAIVTSVSRRGCQNVLAGASSIAER